MSRPEHPGPERRRVPGQFITMDAAMLAQQNERLNELNENIVKLAKAVDTRPTREELSNKAKRDRVRRIAMIALVTLVLFGFFLQQRQLAEVLERNRANNLTSCQDRNEQASATTDLLVRISAIQAQNGEAFTPEVRALYEEAFARYAELAKPVDCELLYNE